MNDHNRSLFERLTGFEQRSLSGQLPPSFPRLLLLVQGVYFLITGIWPLVHLPSFEAISGPKTDNWLVRTVGVLVTVIGAVLCLVGRRERPPVSTEVALLGVGSAAGLAAIDVIYVARRRISPVYLLDVLLEGSFIVAWILAWRRK